MAYTDAHRAFLQVLLQYRILTSTEAKRTHEKICNNLNVQYPDLPKFLSEINEKLEDIHMVIRKSILESHNEDVLCYVLVNNLNNESTRLCSSFSKVELNFVKKLIETLVMSDEGIIRETEVVNSGIPEKLGPTAVENLLDKLVQEKWLLRKEGRISLGALTVCELQTYLEENFEDFSLKCNFCKIFTFRGHSCPECGVRGHRSCMKNYWNRVNKEPCCPNTDCSASWEDVIIPEETRKRSKHVENRINV